MLVNDKPQGESIQKAGLDSGQELFSKQILSRELLTQAKYFKKVTPIKAKEPTSLIKLQNLVDNEISKLLKQGQIEKLEGCLGQLFESLIVKTVKNIGSTKLALESRELINECLKRNTK